MAWLVTGLVLLGGLCCSRGVDREKYRRREHSAYVMWEGRSPPAAAPLHALIIMQARAARPARELITSQPFPRAEMGCKTWGGDSASDSGYSGHLSNICTQNYNCVFKFENAVVVPSAVLESSEVWPLASLPGLEASGFSSATQKDMDLDHNIIAN